MDPTFQAHLTIQPAHQGYQPGNKFIHTGDGIK